MATTALKGAGIVVARAAGRGDTLCRRLEEAGADVLLVPVIDIQPLHVAELPADSPEIVIFTSAAAVEHGLPACNGRITPTTRIAAIGTATAGALRAADVSVDAVPERQETEGLLELPEFQSVSGAAVWIVTGRGGRQLARSTLRARGAQVTVIEVYERRLPATDATPLLEWWRKGHVDALVVSSHASLENLHALLNAEGRRHLGETQLVMPTERMLKLAHELDVRPAPIIATGASDDALLAALVQWHGPHQDSR